MKIAVFRKGRASLGFIRAAAHAHVGPMEEPYCDNIETPCILKEFASGD